MNQAISSIVFVEKDLDSVKSILEFLSTKFKAVYTACNAQEALSAYKKHQPSIVLTNLELPNTDGLSLIEQIKKQDAHARIIVYSSLTDASTIVKTLELGVVGYLFKPFNKNKFEQLIDKINAELASQHQKVEKEKERINHEQQYRSLFETAPIGIVIINKAGQIIDANKQLIKILRTDNHFIKGDNIFEFTPFIRSGFTAAFMQSIEKNAVITRQYEIITKQRDRIHISYQIAPIVVQGQTTIYQAIVEDISMRKEAEYQINYQKSLLDSVLNNIPDLISYKDSEGKYLGVNKAFAEFVGKKASEINGKMAQDIFNEATVEHFIKNDNRTLENKRKSKYKGHLKNKDGQNSYFETIKAPFYINQKGLLGTLAVSRDITANISHINALKYSEERYRGLVESQNDLVIRVSKDNTITYINDAYCAKFSIKREQIVGQVPMAFHLNREQLEMFFKKKHIKRTHRLQTEENFYLKDGKIWISWDFYGVTDAENNVIEIQGVGRDITPIKNTEEQLQRTNEQLKELHDSLEKQVEEAVSDLRTKDHMLIKQSRQAAMGEMIGNIAHQWRQPINSLGLIIQNMQTAFEYKKLTEPYMKEKVGKILDLIRYMSETIDDFKDFFKPQYAASKFILTDVIDKTVKFIESNFEHNNIVISLEGSTDVELSGFPNELSQVILNILVNAKDNFIEQGIKNPQIRIITKRHNSTIAISIADNGGGIDDKLIHKIFEPYFTTKDQGQGTGLGLYMAKSIVERNLNGQLWAENEKAGAVFHIQLNSIV